MGLSKIQVFPKSVMAWMATQHIPVFRAMVQGGLDYKGKRFKMYSTKYADLKGNRFVSDITGKRYKYPKERISSTQVHPPDFTLTGLTLQNLKRIGYTKTYWTIGFRGEPAEIVIGNKKRGRNIIDDLPDKEKAFLTKLLAKQMDKQFKAKLKNVTITVGR